MRTRRGKNLGVALALLLSAVATPSCSVRQFAIDGLANALAEQGDVFASDNDPELVRDALPFALKTLEALIAASPEHSGLRLAACQGFAQYSGGFVQPQAERAEWEDYDEFVRLSERALRLFLRARDWGLSGLELEYPGIGDQLRVAPGEAASRVEWEWVDLLYWTAAAWGAAISLGVDQPELVADIDAAREMLGRVLELDESYGNGAIHETLISVECLPAIMGGDPQKARWHFERAVELSEGKSASPYVAMAASSCVSTDPEEFVRLLEIALRVDPEETPHLRLGNILAQRRATYLLETKSDRFLEPME